jgi:hypothetical protein
MIEPEIIGQMSPRTRNGLREMTLTDDPATRLVASKIIELAQRGRAGCKDFDGNDVKGIQTLMRIRIF